MSLVQMIAAPSGESSMSSPAASTASFRNLLRRFRHNRRGSAALEFALVAPVFFALLFAIIETAIMFFASQLLETYAQEAARLILTGQAQNSTYNTQALFLSNFQNNVCSNILFHCSNISIDVKNYSSFGSIVITNPITGGNFDPSGLTYCPGNAGSIVVVRLFYQWPLFVTGLGYNIANLSGNLRLLAGTAAFQNEPFTAPAAPC
jgi:Flp pilus assembly protein TadG